MKYAGGYALVLACLTIQILWVKKYRQRENDYNLASVDDHQRPADPDLPMWQRLRERLASIKASCGQLCDLDLEVTGVPTEHYNYIHKDVVCRALFQNEHIDAPSEFPAPPAKIPHYMRDLQDEFLYHGKVYTIPVEKYSMGDVRTHFQFLLILNWDTFGHNISKF